MDLEVFIVGTSYFSKVGLDGKYEISEITANTGYILCLQKGEQTQIIKENVEIIAGQNTVIEAVKFSKNNSTFLWLGTLTEAPENPKANDAYFNTTEGIFYLYNGTSWEILAKNLSKKYNGILDLENFLPSKMTMNPNAPYSTSYVTTKKLPYTNQIPNIYDVVKLEFSFTSPKDINDFFIILLDDSGDWVPLADGHNISNIKKGEVINISETFELTVQPKGNIILNLQESLTEEEYKNHSGKYDLSIESSKISVTSYTGIPNYLPSSNTTTQITCNATERGILFEGCSISDTNIFITDKNNDVCMNINYKKPDWYHKWNYTYPLVKKDTEYDFYVRVERSDGLILEEQNFTVTAIGGLGEYKVENTDYEVTLSDDYVLSRTLQEFTNNENVPILDYGTYYQIVSNDKNADRVWTDNTLWVNACDCWNSETQQKYDLHNSSWQDIKSMLQGRALGAEVRTKVKIAGYTYNDTVTFSLNDLNQLVLPRKTENNKKEYKLLVMYGSDFDNLYTDVPNTKKYIMSKDFKSFVSAGTSGAREVSAQEVLISKNLEEPRYIPESFLGKWSAWTTDSEIYESELSFPSSAWDIINYIISNNPDTIISGTDGEYCPILLAPKDKKINKELTFKCKKETWGNAGSIEVDLPEKITVAEGDIVVINGTFEFGIPSAGKIIRFYPQDCVGWDYLVPSLISSDNDDGLNGSEVTKENVEWTIKAKSAGTWSKIQWVLGWEDEDDSNAGATCTVNFKNVTITKK